MLAVKKVFKWFIPGVQRSEDGREQWPSRTAFILASMGVAVGIGNLLRYPSIVYANNGLQWFIPYLLALFFIGIPLLIVEIALGQAYRGGAVIALGRVSRRMRGLGFATVYTGYVVATYYVVILAWAMVYLRHSFVNPLPWVEDPENFFDNEVLHVGRRQEDNQSIFPPPPPFTDPDRLEFTRYPDTAVVGEILGWTMLLWVLLYLCICKGVSLTGRVVYFSMIIPIVLMIIIMIRSVTLEGAGRGIRLYVGEFDAEKLAGGQIWREAVSQIFFSIGTGFGSFFAYASYNSQFANAVQDSLIIAICNSLYEVVAGFAAFGVIGFLGLNPSEQKLGTFRLAFLTYPAAVAKIPGSNLWAVLFFITIIFLGIDSGFGLIEGMLTVVIDTNWGKKVPRPLMTALVTLIPVVLSITYTTEFGIHLLDAVDRWMTNLALVASMWLECVTLTSLYRYKDVVDMTGWYAYGVAQGSYMGSMILGVILAYVVSPAVGVGVFLGIFFGGIVVAVLLSNEPTIAGGFGDNKFINSLWWLMFYPGHQLSVDINALITRGKNWKLPIFWAPLLRFITAPVLVTILSIAYNDFQDFAVDPLHIFGFILAHLALLFAAVSFIIPRSMDIFVNSSEKDSWKKQYAKGPRESPEGLSPEEVAVDGKPKLDAESGFKEEDMKEVE